MTRKDVIMRPARTLLVILALGCVIAFLAWLFLPERAPAGRHSSRVGQVSENKRVAPEIVQPQGPSPVALNRGPEVQNCFQGEVHPLLSGQTRLQVNAVWTPIGEGRDKFERVVSPVVYSWFKSLRPAVPKQTYTERDFSTFL